MHKLCPECGFFKPGSEFSPRPKNRDGLRTYCKACGLSRRLAAIGPTTVCRICLKYKPIEDFPSHPREGILTKCRECQKIPQSHVNRILYNRRVKDRAPLLKVPCQVCEKLMLPSEAKKSKFCCDACKKRARARNFRLELVAAYGGRCQCPGGCTETDPDFLTLDHIAGGGSEHRRETGLRGWSMYRLIKKLGYPKDKYRILCCNCNQAREWWGQCPHERNQGQDCSDPKVLAGLMRDVLARKQNHPTKNFPDCDV